jgi:hypothetical protein
MVHQICSPAVEGAHTAYVSCSVDFASFDCDDAAAALGLPQDNPTNHITQRLRFQGAAASDVVFDCDGATIDASEGNFHFGGDIVEVRSGYVAAQGLWQRPENVTITRCHVIGGTRVYGMGTNGEAEAVRLSSLRADHVDNVRANAPTNVVFDDVVLTGVNRSPLYFAPGVTYSKLVNSEVDGHSNRAAVYLDAESFGNVITNNTFRVHTADGSHDLALGLYDRGWPVLALDGSSHNQVQNNRFLDMANAGVYLYRNCGEGGTIRHSKPQYNTIVNNVFSYAGYVDDPAIMIGSRDYDSLVEGSPPGHCDDDEYDDSPYGSGLSNTDFARHNVVAQNQFITAKVRVRWGETDRNALVDIARGAVVDVIWPDERDAVVSDMIQSRDWSDNSPNYINYNTMETEETVDWARPAGCYLPDADRVFLFDGESEDTMSSAGCYSSFVCRDGDTTRPPVRDCRIVSVPFECQITGSNTWCARSVACPGDGKVVGAKAACNLEAGTVDDAVVSELPFDRLEVVRASDNVADGTCYVSFNWASEGGTTIDTAKGFSQLAIGCREYDDNGGDCQIKGVSYCTEPSSPPPPTTTTTTLSRTSLSTGTVMKMR